MTIPQKAIVSFALSAFLSAGIVFFTYTGGFLGIIESRFYNPAVTEMFIREAAIDAKVLSDELSRLQSRFFALLFNAAVRRSFLPKQEAADVYERAMLLGIHSVRFIDSDGIRILFSTYPQDVLSSDTAPVTYRHYDNSITQKQTKIIIDKTGDGVIFSFPFYDALDVYRGIALFAVSARTLAEGLAAAGRAGAGENLTLCAAPEGIIGGLPGISREQLLNITSVWAGRYQSVVPFFLANEKLALVSVRMDQGFYYGRIVNESVFTFSQPAKILLFAAMFLTMFLTFFLLFNLKQRPSAKNPAVLPLDRFASLPVNERLEELETVTGEHGKGLLAAAALMTASSGDKTTVILEQNGIPYINNDVFITDKDTEEKLDGNFVKLIESVTNIDKT